MILIRYSLFLMLCLTFVRQSAHAQCTTEAGSISGPSFLCTGNTLSINNQGNETLDADDILIFVAYTGAAPNASTVFATSSTVNFAYQGAFFVNSPFKVAAVAGNDAGNGTVDWNDPCLSVSPALTVSYLQPPTLTVGQPQTLTCVTPSVVLIANANQQGLTYEWEGPNGFSANMQNPVVGIPGQYCVTVTNQGGCTATQCVSVNTNIALPNVSIAQPGTLTCANTSIVLDASGSQGPNFVYSWVGPGIVANANNQNPIVNQAGTYFLVVTDVTNGCTSTAAITVIQDAVSPLISAGPDSGIPCGGGTTSLNGSVNGPPQALTFLWTGPGIVSGATTLTPVVDQPGVYTLAVTNLNNGCSSTDEATVFPGPAVPQQDFAITNNVCFGDNSGAISTTFSVGQTPFTVGWSGPNNFTSTTEDITGLPSGIYSLTATDNTGCTHYANVPVSGPNTPIVATVTTTPITCAGGATVILSISGGVQPYLITWSNGATGPVVQGLFPGTYIVTITDALGCSVVLPPVVIVQGPLITITINELSNTCSAAVLQAIATGGSAPYTYAWIGPNGFTSNSQTITTPISGVYTVQVTEENGCVNTMTYVVQLAGGSCGYISGNVIRDTSANCVADAGEPGLGGWLVQAISATDTAFGITNQQGEFFIGVPLGTYTVTAILPNSLWELCPAGSSVNVTVPGDTFPAGDIPVKKLYDCPALSVSIGTNQLRRCFSNNYYFVEYCNEGTDLAEDAYILVSLDAFLSPIGATLPYTNVGNNVLRFDVGDLDPGECGTFSIQVQVSCNAVLGQTHCTEAHIYPDSICVPGDPGWSGASLKLSSVCDADSVHFTVKNIGQGDMTGTVDYVIIEDAVMLMLAPLQALGAGDSTTLSFPANGSTWRLEVDQVAFHPGNSQPSLSVEGCSTNASFSTGFVTQFAANDADPWIDIDCTANIGSYDPNDKQGFPVGYGAQHYIRPGTELEYLIRFQNTGTDTAFTVRVVDTLSAWLDPASVRPGASSHAYQFNLTGPGIIEFLFENILLPDSNVNEPASNGFVKFSIRHDADAPLETVIENSAAIYFDFNEPVITNTTFHRLGENFVLRAWNPRVPGASVKVAPNPFDDEAILQVEGLQTGQSLRLQVFDLRGTLTGEMESSDAVFRLKRGDWPAGVYVFRILQNGQLVGTGKVAVR